MRRTVSALYRTHAVAREVHDKLTAAGISAGYIDVIPDRDEPVTTGSYRDNQHYMDELHDLHLPHSDLATYQQVIRRGDYLVAVHVDDDADFDEIKRIMAHPEAVPYAERHAAYADEDLIGRTDYERGGDIVVPASEDRTLVGRYDSTYSSDDVRSYERDAPLSGRSTANDPKLGYRPLRGTTV